MMLNWPFRYSAAVSEADGSSRPDRERHPQERSLKSKLRNDIANIRRVGFGLLATVGKGRCLISNSCSDTKIL